MHVKRARAAFRVHVCTADDAGMALHLTHIGTATLVIEIDGVRLLTDPAFDPPGATYGFGWGTRSRRLAGPALPAAALGLREEARAESPIAGPAGNREVFVRFGWTKPRA